MAPGRSTGPGTSLSHRIVKDFSVKPKVKTFRDHFPVGRGGKYRKVGMANAVEAVRRGEAIRRAAELYNVPRSTLSDKVLCKCH